MKQEFKNEMLDVDENTVKKCEDFDDWHPFIQNKYNLVSQSVNVCNPKHA